jgi:hypothetical protein
MSTFGRGIRYEMKKITSPATGSGFSTILTVPSNSNYFVFLNYFFDGAGRVLRTVLENGVVNGEESGSAGNWIKWQDYNSTDDNTRFVSSGGSLSLSLGGNATVYYTEVYFGGQSNY